MNNEERIIASWEANANSWIDLIESNGIASRKLITNKAIVDAVSNREPVTALDLGCGEGWLSKALQEKGIRLTGADVVPALIEKAKEKIAGDFVVASYEDIAGQDNFFGQQFDAIIINFALLGKESTEQLLAALPRYLSSPGKLFIQTLYPDSRKSIDDYTTGWKDGSWDGLGEQFMMPYQWYFRTMEDWYLLLHRSGFHHLKVREVLHPQSSLPLSVIFECAVSKT